MQIRTDLAMECFGGAAAMPGVQSRTRRMGSLEETVVTVSSPDAARALDKPCGRYVTLSQSGLIHASAQERLHLSRAVAAAVDGMLPREGDLMVVGLGNRHITADALGSRVIDGLLITRHMKGMTQAPLQGRLRGVCAVAPGVLGVTGMETAEMVHGIVDRVRPAAVIAIDALAARESGRICSTVQITDTGIRPGSGVGNHRLGLTRETLGVPVIAVGVPMVVYAAVIARDALTLLLQDIGLREEEHLQAVEQLIGKAARDGLGDMVVTPREVDEMVGTVARILADGLNIALQKQLTEEEIFQFSHDRM